MGRRQTYRGDPESKLFYLVDHLVGGINTDFSDDTSPDNEFYSIVNFNMDKRGSLYKRMGFGKLNAVSEIFNLFDRIPDTKGKTPEDPNPEDTNDNIVYMKMLRNDNNCFRNLSAFTGEKAYRDYQAVYGGQNNKFELLMVTTNRFTNTSTAWLFECTLPALEYDSNGQPTEKETIIVNSQVYDLPVIFNWDRNLGNIETIEFFDKIYFTSNNKGLVCFDRATNTFSYSGSGIPNVANGAYKPSPMEVRKIGFNVLGDNPLHWIDYKGITTESIQGIYLTTEDGKPLTVIPSGGKFRLNVLYTGSNVFDVYFKEGETNLSFTISINSTLTTTGLKVYDVAFTTVPTTEVEIKVIKRDVNLLPYYDYYEVGNVDPETKPVQNLNIGEFGMCEMYNRAVYYKDDTIWFSEINNFNYVPNYNYVSLPIEPTDKITKIVFFKNVYIIFTKQRIYKMINAFGSSDFQVMPVNLSIGCHAPNTVIPIENELYFASPRGLYALKSSEYREGIENLKELDTKIKKVTADVTMYLGEKTDPAVRYNGISDRAYAIRYKDKYMLFFNTAFQQGDIAALQNLDVLVYQYELKAFSEIKFPIKPTFLFMVDGAIETFCTVPEKEAYTEEETVLEYNFETDNGANNLITDLSGNGNNANMVGNVMLAPGTGILMNGDNAYVKTGVISSNRNLTAGFNVTVKCNLTAVRDGVLYSFKQSTPTGQAVAQSFSISTNWANGYRAEMFFTTSPNMNTMQDTIYWTLRWHRENTNINGAQSGAYSLQCDGGFLVNYTGFNFNMGGSLYQDVASGSFIINHDSVGNYSKYWALFVDSYFPTYSTGWDNGPAQSFDVTQYDTWGYGNFGIRMVGTATSYNGGCSIVYTPYVVIKSGASLSKSASTLVATLNGTAKTHDTPAINKASGSDKQYSCGQQSHDIGYTGQPTIFIDAYYNINAKIAGAQRDKVNIDGFNFTLPYSNPYTITNWNFFTVSGGNQITLNQILKPSYREISLNITTDEHAVTLTCSSEYNSQSVVVRNDGLSVIGNHEWYVSYQNQSSNYKVTIYQDGVWFGEATFATNTIVNGARDNSITCMNLVGMINKFDISQNGSSFMTYTFEEGKGTTIIDRSGNNLNGSLVGNITWSNEKGMKFNGNGYLILPELSSSVRFSNGFSIEFEARFDNIANACKIIDLATSYGTGSSSSLNCSINAGKIANTDQIDFMTTSIDNKTYKVSKENANLTSRHKWKFTVVDNGKNYDVSLLCDGEVVKSTQYNYGGITNIARKSNFIGKSNNANDSLFSGMLYNLKLTINASSNPVPIYVGALYEYDTTYDDFGRAMELEFETKGINLQYPMHSKKLKHIFVKGLGGFNYNNFFFEVYSDGHIVNNPKIYNCYIDEVTRQVVYDYTENRKLSFNEMVSLLGNMRLDYTKLGESTYETRKLVIPAQGKNFTIKMYGESSDYLGIESLGFTFKLGKVREE